MLKVGLTGGIASGKSAVLKHFQRSGAAAIDADEIARECVVPGEPAHQEIVETFGEEYLLDDEALDRKKLGALVFSDPDKLAQLNRILHPRVLERESHLLEKMAAQEKPPEVVVVDAALMIEAGSYRRYDALVITYCPPAIQLSRLMQRDDLDRSEAQARIDGQMPTYEKIQYADFVIVTSGTLAETETQVRRVFARLQEWER